jgi:hypothetical protein
VLCELQLAVHLTGRHPPVIGDTDEMTFRKPALSVFASAGIAVAVTVIAAMVANDVQDLFAGAIVVSLFAYLFWLVGWHSAVRLGRDGVIVDNLLVRHVIPWDELAEIGVGNGLVSRLRDGQRVGSVMFGGSVIGAILGYRYTRSVAARMKAARDDIRGRYSGQCVPGAGYRRVAGFSAWPPLVILAVMEAIASFSLLGK